MENKHLEKKNIENLPFIIFSAVFGVLALSAIIVFWTCGDAEWVELYQMAMRWLVLPICALVASYVGTLKKAPRGLMWLCPVVFGVGISVVEWATYGSFSIVLLVMGAAASLFGFTFAKMDRAEKAREARVAKKRAAMAEASEEPSRTPVADEYNPGSDYIPDEDDTWADKVIAEEGFHEVKVDYAESDPDFSIDAPEEVSGEPTPEEEAVAIDMADDETVEECNSQPEEVEAQEECVEAEETSDDESVEAEEADEEEVAPEEDLADDHCESDDFGDSKNSDRDSD